MPLPRSDFTHLLAAGKITIRFLVSEDVEGERRLKLSDVIDGYRKHAVHLR